MASATYVLNELMRVRLDEPLVCDLLLEGTSVRLPDVRLLAFLGRLVEPCGEDELTALCGEVTGWSGERCRGVVTKLIASGVLRDSTFRHPLLDGAERWDSYGWLDALILHCRTEGQPYGDVVDAARPNDPDAILRERMDRYGPPSFWKRVGGESLVLPEPAPYPDRDLGEVLLARRTHVPWSGTPMTAPRLSRVLADVNRPLVDLRRRAEREYTSRPSVLLENTYGDIETYVAVFDVEGVEPGLYHYAPDRHRLCLVRRGELREEVRTAFTGQERAGGGSCALLMSVVWERHMFRYAHDSRAYRTVMTILGQFAQRYLVALTALGFTTFPTPAHLPEEADELLGTRRFEESGVYLVAAG
ncbi:SagB/ThcOx family dehydrogenase [Streptomyces anulatus]|uniref:SagB/ThcOx family dehydrogenase n=2 Tax=Streptomyces TaxID=1883 RepID=A0A6G3SNP3_STRAQ|nr:SagB/ThcOx family dehydrogenase [Streptomyces anulatus]NEB84584.1 SagB/ThcOx family dehydrogenase [Streptomyces anulatus]